MASSTISRGVKAVTKIKTNNSVVPLSFPARGLSIGQAIVVLCLRAHVFKVMQAVTISIHNWLRWIVLKTNGLSRVIEQYTEPVMVSFFKILYLKTF